MSRWLKVLITVIVVVLILTYIVSDPDQAAADTRDIWHGIVRIGHGLERFINQL